MSTAADAIDARLARAGSAHATVLRLRQDLQIHDAEPDGSGAPAWVLQDPAANRFYRIGWLEREILSVIDGLPAESVARHVREHLGGAASAGYVEAFVGFLRQSNLLASAGPGEIDRLVAAAARGRRRGLDWAMRNHLFLRVPLLRPDRWLTRMLPAVGWLMTPAVFWTLLAVAGLGLFVVGREFDSFVRSVPDVMTRGHWIAYGLGLAVAKVLHEFGHAFATKRFGCRVPTMGLVLIVLWPVLYTDTSDAWRLPSRRQRLLIGAAGMIVELGLAAVCLLAWALAPEGPWRSVLFLLASTTWVLSLAVNLNPFMRFDGYYLLADALGIPNLQPRAFALARWRLREALFGFGETPPEPPQRLMIAYAVATWIYRFFLFLGIALLVYAFVFKALGLVLLVAHVGYFIGRPVAVELREWWRRRGRIRMNGSLLRSLLILAGIGGLLVVPWQERVLAPAVFEPVALQTVYAPLGGRLAALDVAPGARVAPGERLLRIAAPDLDHRIGQLRREVRILARRQEAAALDPTVTRDMRVIDTDLGAALATLRRLRAQREGAAVTAEVAGVVSNVAPDLEPGQWVPEDARLLSVIASHDWHVVAYVDESDIRRVRSGARGRFFPANGAPPMALRVASVAPTAVQDLRHRVLTAKHGGPIPVAKDDAGRRTPEQAVYRVRLVPVAADAGHGPIRPGTAELHGPARSVAAMIWRRAVGLWRREVGG
jgi:putative peptide zinc metalloprotease protein